MPRTLDDDASTPAALTAFLRGVERRGAVFAQLQVGDAQAGDRALVAAMRAFRLPAARIPFADWPRQFWSLLLAAPELRQTPPAPAWGSGFTFLGQIGRGPRAALLLRLVAGLPEADAAAVLGVARGTYRLALRRALPHREDGLPDAHGWRLLGEAAQHAVRDLSAERLAHLARMREAAVQGRRLGADEATGPRSRDAAGAAPARWRWPAIAAAAVATLLAFGATFLPAFEHEAPSARIEVAPLPPAQEPESRYGQAAALLTHPDFDLLVADHDGAAARDPAFYAWLAAGSNAAAPEVPPDVVPLVDAATPAGAEPTETEDAP